MRSEGELQDALRTLRGAVEIGENTYDEAANA